MKQRRYKEAGRPFLLEQMPSMKALCDRITSFLCEVSRIGHVFIVTASAPNFIAKCCRICFPKLLPVFDVLQVNIVYARPKYHEADNEPVASWKEFAYRTVLLGRSIRPLVPALARFYDAPGWSHILSYGDDWGDHASLRDAVAAVSPESVLKVVKARPAEVALSADAISTELKTVGRLLQHVARVDVDFPFDMGDAQVRALVEGLISVPAATTDSLIDPARDSSEMKSSASTVSTISILPETNSESCSEATPAI
jgi:hypothetical protein